MPESRVFCVPKDEKWVDDLIKALRRYQEDTTPIIETMAAVLTAAEPLIKVRETWAAMSREREAKKRLASFTAEREWAAAGSNASGPGNRRSRKATRS